MRFAIAFVAVVAGVVSSQSVSSIVAQIPSCAVTCLATGAAAGGCPVGDYACQCGEKRAAITASATPCVLQGCPSADVFKTLDVVEQLCKAVASSNTEDSTTSPAAVETPTTPVKTESTATSTVVTTTTTPAPAATTPAPTTASGSSFASFVQVPTTTASAPIQVPEGSASKMKAGMGVIGGALLVAIAL